MRRSKKRMTVMTEKLCTTERTPTQEALADILIRYKTLGKTMNALSEQDKAAIQKAESIINMVSRADDKGAL